MSAITSLWSRFFGGSTANRFEGGARGGRRLAAIPSNGVAINTLIRAYGRTLTARSRYLCGNNPYLIAAKEEFVTALVGSGIKPSSHLKEAEDKQALQELWLDWTDEADKDGITDFYGLQAMAAGELFEGGEAFLREHAAPENATVPVKYQVLPTEMLPYADTFVTSKAAPGNTVELGIEFDPSGRRVAYHFYRHHPDAHGRLTSETVRVPAEEVIHLYKPLRAGQIRGLPHSVASMTRVAMMDLYDDNELERKRTTSLFAAFVTKDAGEDDVDHPLGGPGIGGSLVDDAHAARGDDEIVLEGGAIIDLNLGEDVKFAEPADVGANYEPFQYRNLLAIAAGVGVPYASMTGDLKGANYGSMRAGSISFRRRITAIQHHVMVFQMCRPIWLRVLALGTVSALTPWSPSEYVTNRRALTRAKWIPPKWDWIDPLKDRQAEKLAVESGFKSRDDVIEEEGYDPEEMDDRIAASYKRAKDKGVPLGQGLPSQPDPNAPRAPGQEPDEDEGNQGEEE